MSTSTIYETYDLLRDNEHMIRHNNEFLLELPTLSVPLRAVRFRSFKPIIKPRVNELDKMRCKVTITPCLAKIESGHLHPVYDPFTVYAAYGGVLTPLKPYSWSLPFTGVMTELIEDVSELISNYSSSSPWSVSGMKVKIGDQTLSLSIADNVDISLIKYKQLRNLKMQTFSSIKYSGNQEFTFSCPIFTLNNDYAVYFTLSLSTSPTDIIWSSDALQHQAVANEFFDNKAYEVFDKVFAYGNNNFAEFVDASNHIYNNVTLTLTSPYMGNLSTKIYTDMTAEVHNPKEIGAIPSSTHFPVCIQDHNGKYISLEYLRNVYEQVIVEVDFIYGTL